MVYTIETISFMYNYAQKCVDKIIGYTIERAKYIFSRDEFIQFMNIYNLVNEQNINFINLYIAKGSAQIQDALIEIYKSTAKLTEIFYENALASTYLIKKKYPGVSINTGTQNYNENVIKLWKNAKEVKYKVTKTLRFDEGLQILGATSTALNFTLGEGYNDLIKKYAYVPEDIQNQIHMSSIMKTEFLMEKLSEIEVF